MRTLEEKKLLVNAICEYILYEPCIANEDIDSGFPIKIHVGDLRLGKYLDGYTLDSEKYGCFNSDTTVIYLRPMDSMTKEEEDVLASFNCYYSKGELFFSCVHSQNDICEVIDFLKSNLLDYRELIEKGIAKPIGTDKKWVSNDTLKEVTTIIRNTLEEVKKITEDGQKKNRRVKR